MIRPHTPAVLLLLATQSAQADTQPLTLTTDTQAYCTQLAHQIQTRHNPPPEAQRLLTEGQEMCDHGETRAGIRRLRRALVLLHHKPAHEEQPK